MRIYIAGPDVFRPDAAAWAESARRLCAEAGHQALIPLNNEATSAEGICRANFDLIRSADAVAANLNPFRGSEPDSGTCVEVGFALALGLPVVGYLLDTRPQRAKVAFGRSVSGRPVDHDGWHVEDFGLPLNLMLAVPLRVVAGGVAEAIALLPPPA